MISVGDLVAIREDGSGFIEGYVSREMGGEVGVVVETGTRTYVDEEMEHHTHDWAVILLDGKRVMLGVHMLRPA